MNKIKEVIKYLLIFIGGIFFAIYMRFSNNIYIYFIISTIFLYLFKNLKKVNKISKNEKNIIFLFCIIFSFVNLIGYKITINAEAILGFYDQNYMIDFKFIDILGYIYLIIDFYILFSYIIFYLRKLCSKIKINNNVGISNKKDVIIIFIILLLLWLPWLLTYYPGLIIADSTYSIKQALNIRPLTNKYTITYILFIKLCLFISKILKCSNSFGIFISTLIQLIYIALAESIMISWLKNKGVNKYICFIILLFYGLKPFFVAENITVSRDPIFSISMMLLTLNLIDYILSKGKIMNISFIIKNLLLMLVICLFRNNGFCVLFVTSIIIFIIIIKKLTKIKFKYLAFTSLIISLIYLIILSPLYKKLNINEPFVDSVSTMLQQMSNTVANDGKLSDTDKEYMNKLLPLKLYKRTYRPNWVDLLKCSWRFDNDYLEKSRTLFFKTYLNMFIKNPYLFFKGHVMNTYGYWIFNRYELNKVNENITLGNIEQINYEEIEGIKYTNLLENKFIDFKKIFVLEDSIVSIAILNWFILFICLILILNKKEVFIIALAPSLGLFLSLLLAAPNSYWQRYGLANYYLIPIYFIILLYGLKRGRSDI